MALNKFLSDLNKSHILVADQLGLRGFSVIKYFEEQRLEKVKQ